MSGERPRPASPGGRARPGSAAVAELPPDGAARSSDPDIEDWESITENGDRRIDLTGLPDPFPAELAWMAHWQAADGTRCSVLAMNQLANILRRAIAGGPSVPGVDARHGLGRRRGAAGLVLCHPLGTAAAQGQPRPAARHLPVRPAGPARPLLRRARGGLWMTGIPGATRGSRCRRASRRRTTDAHPGRSPSPWLREAVKWHLGTMLESGALRWSTVSQERLPVPAPLRPLAGDRLPRPPRRPRRPGGSGRAGGGVPPVGRRPGQPVRQQPAAGPRSVHPRLINDDLRAVAELFAFVAANPAEARRILGPVAVGRAHRGARRQLVPAGDPDPAPARPDRPATTSTTTPSRRSPPRCPCSGCRAASRCRITRGDGTQVLAGGLDDPQAMRMILLQILTGRRASEIRTCDFDCLSPARPGRRAADGEEIARFRYAQSKIDIAPGHHPRRP